MKKKKVMASLVLSAMLVGTLGTSVSATSAWKPDGTPGTSNTGGQGIGSGVGIVTRERHEELFLVAVPTSARKYEFYADPTGKTLDNNDKFQFQRENQKWEELDAKTGDPVVGDTDPFAIVQGRENFSNIVAVYNAGSKDVELNVSAIPSIRNAAGTTVTPEKEMIDITVVSTVLNTGKRASNADTGLGNGTSTTAFGYCTPTSKGLANVSYTNNTTVANARGYAVQDANVKTMWKVSLPGTKADADPDWIGTETVYSPGGIKYTKDYAVSLETYNSTAKDEEKLKEFKYPVALFALVGDAKNPSYYMWDEDITARLAIKWYITDPTATGPRIEQSIVITDIENGNKVPVSLGTGAGAMNDVKSVKWVVSPEEDPNHVGFEQELLGTFVEYVPTSGSTGNLVFDQAALRTLYNYESLNGSLMVVTFEKPGVEDKTAQFVLWVY